MKRTDSLGQLALIVACFLQPGLGSYWTGTQLFVNEPTTYARHGRCVTTEWETRWCTTLTILSDWNFAVKHTSTPTGVTPISTTTTTDSYWDLEIVSVYLPAGALPQSDLVNYNDDPTITTAVESYGYTDWVVDLIFTAPTSCPTPFEYTTTSQIGGFRGLPSPLSAILLPKATAEAHTTLYTDTVVKASKGGPRETFTKTLTITTTYLHLKPSDLAPKLRPHTDDDRFGIINSYYIQHCDTPEAAMERGWPKRLECHHPDYHDDPGGCYRLPLWVVIIAAVVPSLFLLGLVENFFWFRRLMQGKWCFRFGTVCWFVLAFFVAWFSMFEKERSPDDQARLKEQWKAIPFGTKVKLWLKWGFRHKYPVEWLGVRKPVGEEESIEMRTRGGGRASGGTGNSGSEAQDGENDMPLPAYPGPPSSRISDAHSMNSGTTVVNPGPVLGNPNAVLAPVLGSGSVVIGPTITSAQPQIPTQQPETDRGAPGDGFRAV